MMDEEPMETTFATMTHARLRASQGDASGARTILERILVAEPDHAAAIELLQTLSGGVDDRPTVPTIRIRRLERWLARVKR